MSHHLHEFWKARTFWKAKTTFLKSHSVAMCRKCHQNNETHRRKTINIGKILSRTTSSPPPRPNTGHGPRGDAFFLLRFDQVAPEEKFYGTLFPYSRGNWCLALVRTCKGGFQLNFTRGNATPSLCHSPPRYLGNFFVSTFPICSFPQCQTCGRLNSRGPADRRKQSLGCGGGGYLLMGIGKSQITISKLKWVQFAICLYPSKDTRPRRPP
jgi:hypothetical protein